MTVGIVYRVPGQGAVLACDSRVTSDSGAIYTDTDEKWLVGGGYVASCAGGLGGLWYDLREAPPRTWRELRTATVNPEAETKMGLAYELLVYDRKADQLWTADHQGDATRKGLFAAIGCGGTLALGVLEASAQPRTLEAAERLVRRAVKVACKHNSFCGGRVRVLVVKGKRSVITVR